MTDIIVGGYDSAWGVGNRGALAYLRVKSSQDGQVVFDLIGSPTTVDWTQAAANVIATKPVALAIDQPLVVANATGCRPIERLLAQQLHGAHCAAYPANTSNPCFSANAPLWGFLNALDASGFSHDPCGARQGAPTALTGHRYFECYPHLAILGLTGRQTILKYKVRHRNAADWQSLLALLASRVNGFTPASFSAHTKSNEDKVDAVVCALVAGYWLADASSSEIIGSLSTGYIVSPLSPMTRQALAHSIVTCTGQALPARRATVPTTSGPTPSPAAGTTTAAQSASPAGAVVVAVNDPGALWTSQNAWMTKTSGFAQLRITLLDEDGAPELVFVPFGGQGGPGVKIDDGDPENKAYWATLAAGASNANVLQFDATFTYVP